MAERRLVIAIDCDDVLVDTAHDLIDFYNTTYGTNISEKDFYAANEESLRHLGVNNIQEAILRFDVRLSSHEHQTISPDPSTVEVVKRLARSHELHLVTGRQQTMEQGTYAMLDTYFAGCFTTVEHINYITADEAAIKRTKSEVCQSIDADVLIDDNLDHVKNVIDGGIEKAIVFGDFDWGKRDALPDRAVRCADWQEVERELAETARHGAR